MRRIAHIRGVCLALLIVTHPALAADTNAPASAKPASPIVYFRQLLAMTQSERSAELAKRPEHQRAALLAKIEEYSAMPANERELRLRATELRYFLLPMMSLSAAEREARLKSVPEDIRDLVENRLLQWSLIPPTFQAQLIENQAALQLFSRMNPNSPANADELIGQLPTSRVNEMTDDLARWQALSEGERTQLLKAFTHFFQLTPAEQERTLRTLSPQERLAMDRTLKQFDALPPPQRTACIRGFQQFMLMPPGERATFLKNAERWQAMTPEDREQWRTAVNHVSQGLSQMAPLPYGVEPVVVLDTPPLPVGFVPPAAPKTN